jgi:hypothetical protein
VRNMDTPLRKTLKGVWVCVVLCLIGAFLGKDVATITFVSGPLALIPANIAYRKGRNFWKWFAYGFFLWIIAIIHSIAIKDNDAIKIAKGWHKCPYCGEYSRPEATVCHCCGRDLF